MADVLAQYKASKHLCEEVQAQMKELAHQHKKLCQHLSSKKLVHDTALFTEASSGCVSVQINLVYSY